VSKSPVLTIKVENEGGYKKKALRLVKDVVPKVYVVTMSCFYMIKCIQKLFNRVHRLPAQQLALHLAAYLPLPAEQTSASLRVLL